MAENVAERAIQEIVDTLIDAWNRHDAHAFAKCFAEDAQFTNVFGVVANGRAEIESGHAAIFRTIFRSSHVTQMDVTVRLFRPDTAAVDVRWELTGSFSPDGNHVPLRQGLMNFIVTENKGTWPIAIFHNQDTPPPERMKALQDLWKQ